tara:strand:+ start:228 stop:1031 length:804 start_codon:yes stop_codon:yes gene_type:complete
MESICRKLIFFAVPVFLSLSLGYGEGEEGDVKVPNSPTQITITLRSDFTIAQPLDPDPQYEKTEEPQQEKGKKKKVKFGRRVPPRPAYKADAKYQSLNRFENSVTEIFKIELEKKNELKDKRIRETVKLQDKPLVFGSRGFNIEVFGHERPPAVDVDYVSHLREPPPLLKPIGEVDHLDPEAEYSRDTKELIYGETRIVFGKMPPPLVEPESVKLKTELKKPLEKHPDSILVIPPGKESIAVISRNEKSLDLLVGNENLNKKRFRSE